MEDLIISFSLVKASYIVKVTMFSVFCMKDTHA